MCALLYESFENVYPVLNKEFNRLVSFKSGLYKIQKDKIRIRYHHTIFKKVRNQVIFHFDSEVIQESLSIYKANSEKVIFGETHSPLIGDMDFPLADELIYHLLMGTSQFDDASKTKFIELVEKVVDLSKKFINSSEYLIKEVLNNLGFEFEEVKGNS
jgi:hypothetical protein